MRTSSSRAEDKRPEPSPLRYWITDRQPLGGIDALLQTARRILPAVNLIQIREKDLPARDLYALTCAMLQLSVGTGVSVLVNSRLDIALAAGAAGVHLPSNSPPPSALRKIAPVGFQFGLSCHSLEELRQAETDGADYALFSPIFQSPSKGSPLGLEKLAEAAQAVQIPIFALGGISEATIPACLKAGASGVAAIRLFQEQ